MSGHTGKQRVRIIGGRWRGRKLDFQPVDGLRPTGDRIRETLFNWLTADIHGARCLDLFAGTGALGLEAISRGAAHCDFVDNSAVALSRITQHLEMLGATGETSCHQRTAGQFLDSAMEPYDIVFVDAPFSSTLAEPACIALEDQQLLKEHSLVYVETDAKKPAPGVPSNWYLHRDKVSGAVAYRLFRRDGSDTPQGIHR